MYQRPVVKKTAAENCALPETQLSGITYGSLSPSSHIHKAKVLDTHFPSMKRRRLSEYIHKILKKSLRYTILIS